MNVLVLLHDAYGGYGGIAKFNRDFLAALDAHPAVERVVAVPRVMPLPPEHAPAKVVFDRSALGGKARFFLRCLHWLMRERFDLVICGNINLMPAAWLWRATGSRPPIVLAMHGIDAWTPPRGALARRLAPRADRWISVSTITRDRFAAWSKADPQRVFILPNGIDLDRFRPGPKDPALVTRYGLAGRRVVMSLARLVANERYKGIDQVLSVLPALVAEDPTIVYMIVGDGDDRARLAALARDSGVADHVIFAGYVSEAEKAAHYRLADLFAMPSRGEGFGIVFLEALACGVPVVAGATDGAREALLDGKLGLLVDPDDPAALAAALRDGLRRPRGAAPAELDRFSDAMYRRRALDIIDCVARATGRGER